MNEKKVYAVADVVPARKAGMLTAGKKYEVKAGLQREGGFFATDDSGGHFYAAWEGSAHLDGRNWRRVEE